MDQQDLMPNFRLEILLSTMYKTSLAFLDSMFPHHKLEDLNVLIINQTEVGKELQSDFKNIRVINSYQKGLSLSRNMAIENALGEICLLADDDVEYLRDFDKVVTGAFDKFAGADVIQFKIETFTGKPYKLYLTFSKQLIGNNEIKRASSIEIAFKKESILSNNIKFNHDFGLGSYFPSGEEYLFLKEVLNKKLNIYFESEFIVKHHLERSTSDWGSDDFVKTKAVMYYIDYNIFGYFTLLKFIIFLIRKQMISFGDFMEKYKVGCAGIQSYKNLKNARQ